MMDSLLQEVREEQDQELRDDGLRTEVGQRLKKAALRPRTSHPRPRRRSLTILAFAAASLLAVGGALAAWNMPSSSDGGSSAASSGAASTDVNSPATSQDETAPPPQTPAPLTYVIDTELTEAFDGFVSAGPATGRVHFSDGSEVTLGERALVRVLALEEHGAAIAIERGVVHARVEHRERTRWRFLAGPFVVRVVGTKLNVEWDADRAELRVGVAEGQVEVAGACLESERALSAGESLRIDCPEFALSGTLGGEQAGSPAPTIQRPADRRPVASGPAILPSTPRTSTRSVGEELANARRASAAGEFARARRSLEFVRREVPASNDAAVAAFLLGRLALDEQQNYEVAVEWFRTCVNERPHGPLVREARGRLFGALEQAGHEAEAQQAAADYLTHHPHGPHALGARALLARLRAR